ncbi:MAG: Maf family protein [Planctomycetota bacterium]
MRDTTPNIPLVLASASEARAELLRSAGLRFSVIVSNCEEKAPSFSDPVADCLSKALMKALDVSGHVERGVVIGADTIALLNSRVIGKPLDEQDARRTLRELSNNPHQVVTGVAIVVVPDMIVLSGTESTSVFMRPMSDEEIDEYVRSGEALGRAGSYAVQRNGDKFVERMEGSFSNVVGLPMELLFSLLDILIAKGIAVEGWPGGGGKEFSLG